MLAQSSDARRRSTGNGATTEFAAPPVISEDQLEVKLYDLATGDIDLQILNTDYTVTGANTFLSADDSTRAAAVVVFGVAPSADYDVIIDRIPTDDQTTDMTTGGGLDPESIERRFDQTNMAIQAVRQLLARAIILPDGETFDTVVDGDGDAVTDGVGLPAERAGFVIGFDPDTGALRLLPNEGAGAKGDTGATGAAGAPGAVSSMGNGLIGAPALAWTNDLLDGLYRAGSHDQRYVINGADILQIVATGLNVNGALDVSGKITAAYLAVDGASPAQITSNQNDYALPAAAGHVRLDLDAARSLTGIAAPTGSRIVKITNISAFNLTLAGTSSASSAANRFAFSYDFVLPAGFSVELFYDETSTRWRIANSFNIATASDIWQGSLGNKMVTAANLAAAYAWVNSGSTTSGATLTFDGSAGFNQQFAVSAVGNFTLGAPAGLIPGRDYKAEFTLGATARTWGTPDAAWIFPGGTNQALSIVANKVDYLLFTALTATTALANMIKAAA